MNNQEIKLGPGAGAYRVGEIVIEEFVGSRHGEPLTSENLEEQMQGVAAAVQDFRTQVEAAGGLFNGVAQGTVKRRMENYRGSEEMVNIFFGLANITER